MHEGEPVTGVDVVGCERCEANHEGLVAHPMPSNSTSTTHFAVCPERTEPILLCFPATFEEDLAKALGGEHGP